MFKTSLFVLLVAVSVTMVLSRPGGYGGVQESKPVGGYGGSGSSFGGSGSSHGGSGSNYGGHDDKLDGFGKPGRPGDGYNNNLRDSDSRRHYDNERRGGYDDKHHAPGAYDNDNHRHGGHDNDRQRGHDSHHAPGAYDNDNQRRGGSGRHDSHSQESYEHGQHGGHSKVGSGSSYGSNTGSGKYSSGKPGY